MSKDDIKDLTNASTPIEHRQKILRGLISGIPFGIGSILSEYLPNSKLEKMKTIISQLNDDLERLKDKIDGEYVKQDDVLCLIEKTFKTLYETYDSNKIAALKNGLVRVIADKTIEVDRKDFYINLLSSLTPFHFRVLSLTYNTEEYLKENKITLPENVSSGRIHFFKLALPDMNEEEIVLVYSDLVSKRLVQDISLGAGSSQSGANALKGLETKFGQEFMNFFKNYPQ